MSILALGLPSLILSLEKLSPCSGAEHYPLGHSEPQGDYSVSDP